MASSPTGRMLVARGLYRRWLTKYFSTVTLAGLAPDDEPILLRKVYVPLLLTQERISEYAAEGQIHYQGKLLGEWLDSSEGEKVFLISGEAGSGKTTLVSAVVDSLAGEVGDDLNKRFEGWVPIPIRLREAPLERLSSLSELVNWWLGQACQEVPDLDLESIRAFLHMGQSILLLDGLDEVGSLDRRTRVMSWLRDHPWVRGHRGSHRELFISQGISPNIVIVTARPSGFEGLKDEDLPTTQSIFVAPFSRGQIRTYLTRWFELRPLRNEQRQSTVENLVIRLTSSEESGRLLPLARRPAYLASLAFVHGTRGELPYTRAALYEQLVEAYIEMLDRQRGVLDRAEQAGELPVWDRQEKIEVLSAVAFQAHVGTTSKQKNKNTWARKDEDRRFLWIREELEGAVRIAVENGADRFRTIRSEHVSQLTSYFVARTGLLVETREGQYQFGHLSFQEFLTALFVLNRATAGSDKAAELERMLFPRLGDSGWIEVGVLVLAIDANRSGGRGHEPILARLDLNKPEHLAFMAQLLSGEEIRFTPAERQALVLVWLTFWATRRDDSGILQSALRFPANHEILEAAWRAACAALRNGGVGLNGLVRLAEQTLAGLGQPARFQRGLDALLIPASDHVPEPEMHAAQRVWSRLSPITDTDLPSARLLVVPLVGDFIGRRTTEANLVPLLSRIELFLQPEPGRVLPTRILDSLNTWSLSSPFIFEKLTEQVPLLWWLQDEFFGVRASSLGSGGMPLIFWRETLRKRLLRIEQAWWTGRLITHERSKRVLALDRARDLARDRTRDLSLVRELVLDKCRDLALNRARDLARDRDWTRDRSRDLDWNPSSEWHATLKGQALDRERALDRINSVLRLRKKHLEKSQAFREQALDLFQAAIQSVSLNWLLKESPPIRRNDLESTLDSFRDSQLVISSLQGTAFAKQALLEWEDVLASPFSPIPLLKETLSQEWTKLPADSKGIAQLFDKALSELEKKV